MCPVLQWSLCSRLPIGRTYYPQGLCSLISLHITEQVMAPLSEKASRILHKSNTKLYRNLFMKCILLSSDPTRGVCYRCRMTETPWSPLVEQITSRDLFYWTHWTLVYMPRLSQPLISVFILVIVNFSTRSTSEAWILSCCDGDDGVSIIESTTKREN